MLAAPRAETTLADQRCWFAYPSNPATRHTMRRILFCASALMIVLFGLPALAQQPSAPARRPNFVIILADDYGYADAGFQGCKDIPTPQIDTIAAGGVVCTSGYVSGPYCSPTRAGLLTGRYQQRFGHEFNPGASPELGL